MSLIEATIRISNTPKNICIKVEYGTGKTRVPEECKLIPVTIRHIFADAMIQQIEKNLKTKMPDVKITRVEKKYEYILELGCLCIVEPLERSRAVGVH